MVKHGQTQGQSDKANVVSQCKARR